MHPQELAHLIGTTIKHQVSAVDTSYLDPDGSVDKQHCWNRCLENTQHLAHMGVAEMCGKCPLGPCSHASAV